MHGSRSWNSTEVREPEKKKKKKKTGILSLGKFLQIAINGGNNRTVPRDWHETIALTKTIRLKGTGEKFKVVSLRRRRPVSKTFPKI